MPTPTFQEIHSLLAQPTMPLFRSEFALSRASKSADARTIGFVCSTEGTKRDGHRILTAGWQLENYLRTGAPVLWCHDVTDLAIGIAPTMRVDGKRLIAEVTFAKAEDYPFADTVYRLYAAEVPIMRSGSVQWKPLEVEPNLDEKGRQIGITYKRQELLEFSLCPVPADPEAIVRAIQSRLVSGEEIERLARRVGQVGSPIMIRLSDAATDVPEAREPEPTPLSPASVADSVSVTRSAEQSVPPVPEPHSEQRGEADTQEGSPVPPAASLQRGELADAIAADDEANLWDAYDAARRAYGTMIRIVYQMVRGASDNATRVDALLLEFAELARPHLLIIADNKAKRMISVETVERGLRPSILPSVGASADAPQTLAGAPTHSGVDVPALPTLDERLARLASPVTPPGPTLDEELSARLARLAAPPVTPPDGAEPGPSVQEAYFDQASAAHTDIASRLRRLTSQGH